MPRKSSSFWRLLGSTSKAGQGQGDVEKWAKEKEAGKISMDAVEELSNGKHTIFVQS